MYIWGMLNDKQKLYTMTTLKEITKNYAPKQKRIFITAWKQLFNLAKKDNFTDEQANRLSFEILVVEEGILELI